jgi:hypothetical protein
MENIHIEASKYTPEMILDSKNSAITLIGKSYPENTFEFYQPLLAWVEEFFQNPKPTLTIKMEIIYFNSSSSKLFFDFFDLLEEHQEKTKLTIEWIYDEENESALEAGEDFIEDFEELPIKLIMKS